MGVGPGLQVVMGQAPREQPEMQERWGLRRVGRGWSGWGSGFSFNENPAQVRPPGLAGALGAALRERPSHPGLPGTGGYVLKASGPAGPGRSELGRRTTPSGHLCGLCGQHG